MYIGNNAYVAKDLVIPSNVYDFDGTEYTVTNIGNNAFYDCAGITGSLTLPDTLATVGVNAFNNCTGITGSLTLSSSLTAIGENAFNGCTGITGITNTPGQLGINL
jgi:hypothetical protein